MEERTKVSICQSCGMPMTKPADFGTSAGSTKNEEYCCFCFRNGKFTTPDMTMEQMIDKLACFAPKMKMSEKQAREMANKIIPKLKRWQNKMTHLSQIFFSKGRLDGPASRPALGRSPRSSDKSDTVPARRPDALFVKISGGAYLTKLNLKVRER